jgi:branched-chain amino acid transport system substrate-binding protein
LVGDAQTQFYPQAASSGLHLPTLSTVQLQQSYEHKRFKPPALDGMLVPTDYQEELDLAENTAFVKRFRAKYAKEPYINENARSAYVAVNLMAQAWQKAGSTDTDKTIEALESGLSFDAPSGPLTLNPAVHHCAMPIYLAEVKGRDLEFPVKFGTLQPDWLSTHMHVDLRKSDPERQYTPSGDPQYAQFLKT